MGRIDVTQEVLDQLFTKYDQNNDGSIDFPEYLEMMVQLQEEKKTFGHLNSKDEGKTAIIGGVIEGTKHSYEVEERNTMARLFNAVLDSDEFVGERFPINPESDDLWHVMADGMVLIRLLNTIDKDAIDMRAVNKGKNGNCNIFEVRQNINLGLTAAKGKIKLIGVNDAVFLEKKPHMLLGVCF